MRVTSWQILTFNSSKIVDPEAGREMVDVSWLEREGVCRAVPEEHQTLAFLRLQVVQRHGKSRADPLSGTAE